MVICVSGSDPASLREGRAANELCGGMLKFLKICRMLVDLCLLALPNHCNKEDDFHHAEEIRDGSLVPARLVKHYNDHVCEPYHYDALL